MGSFRHIFFSLEPVSKTWYLLDVCLAWFHMHGLARSARNTNQERNTKWKIFVYKGFEPGTVRLRSRRATNCATKSDIHNQLKASAHSFKQFTSRLLKSTFSLPLCTYITRMDVMLEFICMGPVDLPGARRKRQNTKWKISCPQWDSNPQPFDSKSDALSTELAGLGECYPFKWPYYIHHVLPILMYTLL